MRPGQWSRHEWVPRPHLGFESTHRDSLIVTTHQQFLWLYFIESVYRDGSCGYCMNNGPLETRGYGSKVVAV